MHQLGQMASALLEIEWDARQIRLLLDPVEPFLNDAVGLAFEDIRDAPGSFDAAICAGPPSRAVELKRLILLGRVRAGRRGELTVLH